MTASHGKIFRLVPYDVRPPSLARLRRTLWSARERSFLVPTFFGAGWTVNLRSAYRHPVQAFLLAGLVWWLRSGRRG